MSLYQRNDQEILVPITDSDGNEFDLSAITSATYKLLTRDRKTVLITKSLNNGITRSVNTLTITITEDDCEDIRGTYYHEASITDPVKGFSTVLNQAIYFEPTEIKP
jgi:hypothetical protein